MKLVDVLTLAVLAIVVFFAIRKVIRLKKSGGCSCGTSGCNGNCAHCSQSCSNKKR